MRWELWTVSDGVIATVLHKLNLFPQPMTQDPQRIPECDRVLKMSIQYFSKLSHAKDPCKVSASVKNPIPKDLSASLANPKDLYSCKMGLGYRGNE